MLISREVLMVNYFIGPFEEYTRELDEIDPERLLDAKSLIEFLSFIKYFRIISNELPDDYFFQLFAQSRLQERSKIALAASVIYNDDHFLKRVIGSIFTYFNYKLLNTKYSEIESVRFFTIHCLLLLLFEEREGRDLRPIILERLASTIPKTMLENSAKEIENLVKEAFTSCDTDFDKKYREFIPHLQPQGKIPYSIVIIKELLKLILSFYPNSSIPLLELFTSELPISKDFRSKWITSTIDCSADHPPPKKNLNEFIELLEDLSRSDRMGIRLSAHITAWLLTNNIKYIKKGINDPAKRVRKRCQNILNNPERELKRRKQRKEMIFKELSMLFIAKKGKIPSVSEAHKSVYVFKIVHGGASRTVALTGEHTLEDLHNTIQEVFEWDNDHLYAFFMNNRAWSKIQAYYSPHDQEVPSADEKQLYTLGLVENKKFLYFFDFGDVNDFRITVKKITSQEEIEGPFPLLLHQRGKAPEQYPDWE